MEPRREEPKTTTTQPKEKARRFRIVKLEERIAPSCGGGKYTHKCTACECTVNCGGVSIE